MFIAEDACHSLAAQLTASKSAGAHPTPKRLRWWRGQAFIFLRHESVDKALSCSAFHLQESWLVSAALWWNWSFFALSPLPQYPPERRCFIIAKTIDSGGRLCGPEQATFPLRPSIYHLYCEQIESGSLTGSW